MKHKHIISAAQFDTEFLDKIFKIADKIKASKFDKKSLNGKIMATLFYEPSTRTRFSFESAMLKVGGSVISTENAREFSSAAKGETIEDTVRILNSYCDVIVLRHYNRGTSQIAAQFSKVPVINAGDGNGEHPTQALLDLYTIFSRFKNRNLTITLVGDLLNGRTIHSLSLLISLYPKMKMIFVSPKALAIPDSLRKELISKKANFTQTEDLQSPLSISDVIYMTRIQKERFTSEIEYKKYLGKYVISKDSLSSLKKDSIILHPLPRVNEIDPEVDADERAYYFQQAGNGLFIREALLLYLFDKI